MPAQPIKWYGGKEYLADWIVSLMPPRDTWHLYRDSFAGSLRVLFHLDPAGLGEAVNDIHGGLSNFWRVLRDPDAFARLHFRLTFTPFSMVEFRDALPAGGHVPGDAIESAARFFTACRQSRMGQAKNYATVTSRLRRGMSEQVSAWLSSIDGLSEAHERLQSVEVCNMQATEFIRAYDHPRAVHYVDPPYLHTTRTSRKAYKFEMTEADHAALLGCLSGIKGRFLLSGYHSQLYDDWARQLGWRCEERLIDNKASTGAKKRTMTECVWMNY